jgi:type IV pilus assembly protein PilW
MNVPTLKHQRGLSLIELMIALVISLFLLLALFQIFQSNKQGFRVQEWQSRLQENARAASFLLSHNLHLAGYKTDSTADNVNVFTSTSGVILSGTAGGSTTTPDTVTFSFQDDSSIPVCTGAAPPGSYATPQVVTEQFLVNTTNRTLSCTTTTGGVTSGQQILIRNVDNMKILYGVDLDGDGSVDQYVKAGSVGNWDTVRSIAIGLLLASGDPNATTEADRGEVKPDNSPSSYTFFKGTSAQMTVSYTDRIQRRLVTRYISLENNLIQ